MAKESPGWFSRHITSVTSEGWLSSFLSPPFLHAPGLEKEATMSADKFLPNSPGFPGSLRKRISQQRLTVKIKERPNLVLCFRLPAPGRSRARSETGRPLGKAVGSSQFSQLSFCSTGSPLSAGLYFRQGPQAEQSPTLASLVSRVPTHKLVRSPQTRQSCVVRPEAGGSRLGAFSHFILKECVFILTLSLDI